jgi:hypothetical protein
MAIGAPLLAIEIGVIGFAVRLADSRATDYLAPVRLRFLGPTSSARGDTCHAFPIDSFVNSSRSYRKATAHKDSAFIQKTLGIRAFLTEPS